MEPLFRKPLDLFRLGVRTEYSRYPDWNQSFQYKIYAWFRVNTVLKTAANYPGCQRLFMRGYRFRVFKVAASQKKLRGLIDFIKLIGSRFKVLFCFVLYCLKFIHTFWKIQEHKKRNARLFKDVRAHCYCASLVRTLYMTWRVPRHIFQARTESKLNKT